MFFAPYMDVARGSLLRSSHILRFPKWMRMKTARRTDHGQHLIWKTRTNFGNDILWLSALLVSFVCPFPWGLWDVVRFWWYDFRAPKTPQTCHLSWSRVIAILCHLQVFNHRYLRNLQENIPVFFGHQNCIFFFPGRWNCLQVASRSHSTLGSNLWIIVDLRRESWPSGVPGTPPSGSFFSNSERCISQHLHHVLWCDSVFN